MTSRLTDERGRLTPYALKKCKRIQDHFTCLYAEFAAEGLNPREVHFLLNDALSQLMVMKVIEW